VINEKRCRVIECSRSWKGTKYHHHANVKGGGVDCLYFIAESYREAGVIDVKDIPHYQFQWNLHKGDETYMDGILRYAHEITSPLPGDIALWKIGRTFSHAAIVIDWPHIIHAVIGTGVTEENVDQAVWLKFDHKKLRPVKFFSYW
jgi:cell wall-associated NlpC family hydrolase